MSTLSDVLTSSQHNTARYIEALRGAKPSEPHMRMKKVRYPHLPAIDKIPIEQVGVSGRRQAVELENSQQIGQLAVNVANHLGAPRGGQVWPRSPRIPRYGKLPGRDQFKTI